MNVFISYSSADRDWAEKLKSSLSKHGISVWSDNKDEKFSWMERVGHAIRGCDGIIVLLEPKTEPDELQRRTWQLALEAVWAEPDKALISFLLGNIDPPQFLRAALSKNSNLPVVRALDPNHDWDSAVNTLAALLYKQADLSQVEQLPSVTEKDIEEHLRRREQIETYVQNLKANMNLP